MKKFLSLSLLALLTMSAGAQTTVTTLSEANALEDNSEFTFSGNAVVTVQMTDYLFVRDESGYGLIYGAVDGTFENGQVLSQGWNATKASVNAWNRYTDAAGLSASGETNAELAAPIVATSIDESMVNAYVCYKNVTFSMFQRKITLEDGTTIPVYNMFPLNMPAGMGDQKYNAYGIIGYQGTTLKFIPVEWVKIVVPSFLRGDVDGNQEVGIADVTALINYLLTGDETGIQLVALDCDENSEVGIADVTALINFLLTGTW